MTDFQNFVTEVAKMIATLFFTEAAFLPLVFVVLFGLFLLVIVYPVWRIIVKTGLSPWLTLLVLVPGLGPFLIMGILALVEWPASEPEKG